MIATRFAISESPAPGSGLGKGSFCDAQLGLRPGRPSAELAPRLCSAGSDLPEASTDRCRRLAGPSREWPAGCGRASWPGSPAEGAARRRPRRRAPASRRPPMARPTPRRPVRGRAGSPNKLDPRDDADGDRQARITATSGGCKRWLATRCTPCSPQGHWSTVAPLVLTADGGAGRARSRPSHVNLASTLVHSGRNMVISIHVPIHELTHTPTGNCRLPAGWDHRWPCWTARARRTTRLAPP